MNFDEASAWSMRFTISFLRTVEDLRDVNELDRQTEPFGASALMHDARHVGGDDVLGAGTLVIGHLVVAHLRRHRLLEYGEGAAEPAALIRTIGVDEADSSHLGQQ